MNRLVTDNLTKTEQLISKTILEMGDEFNDMSIDQVASAALVSPSMIVKYSKKLGFTGFKDLKYYVINSRPKVNDNSVDFNQFQETKVMQFFQYMRTHQYLVMKITEAILECDYTVIYGRGASCSIAQCMSSKISDFADVPVIVQTDEKMMDVEIAKRKPDRLVLILSSTLSDQRVIDVIEKLEANDDNYYVIYECDNYHVNSQHAVKLSNVDYQGAYTEIGGRIQFYLFLELVINNINSIKKNNQL